MLGGYKDYETLDLGVLEPKPVAKMIIWRRQRGFLEAGSNGKCQCTPAIQNRGGGLVGGRSSSLHAFDAISEQLACITMRELTSSADSQDLQMLSCV